MSKTKERKEGFAAVLDAMTTLDATIATSLADANATARAGDNDQSDFIRCDVRGWQDAATAVRKATQILAVAGGDMLALDTAARDEIPAAIFDLLLDAYGSTML